MVSTQAVLLQSFVYLSNDSLFIERFLINRGVLYCNTPEMDMRHQKSSFQIQAREMAFQIIF